MKLVHPDLQFQVEFAEQIIPVFIVESPVRWRDIQRELLSQYHGGEGKWMLSDQEKEIKFNKSVEMIMNPMILEENDRRIVNAFLQTFGETASNEVYWKRAQDLNVAIQKFFSEIESEYPFEYNIHREIDFPALAKAMGIRLESEYENDLERLIQYCILTKEIMHVKLFIFFNLHSFFTEKELGQLYQEIIYRKWNVLLFETAVFGRISGEKYYIID